MVEYFGAHPSSAFAFALDKGICAVISLVMYGAISRGSQAGTLSGAGAPQYSARALTISLMLTARSSTISYALPAGARSSAANVALTASSTWIHGNCPTSPRIMGNRRLQIISIIVKVHGG